MIGVQIAAPESGVTDEFRRLLADIRGTGAESVEINVVDPETFGVADLAHALDDVGLVMTHYATGADANRNGLSLAAESAEARHRAVERCRRYIEVAARLGAGIIIGLLKGGPGSDAAVAARYVQESLAAVAPHARGANVPVYLEATNHYEASVARTLDEAWEIIAPLGEPLLQILPDTYHMNIEETNVYAALERHFGRYGNVHVSDNTRRFPGCGRIDFKELLGFLASKGYEGDFAIEGVVDGPFRDELSKAMRYLEAVAPTSTIKQPTTK